MLTLLINQMQIYCFMHKIVHRLLPSYFLNILNLNSDIHSYETRRASKFHIHYCNTKLRALSIHNHWCKLWNLLTLEISSARAMQVFKNKCRQYLIQCH